MVKDKTSPYSISQVEGNDKLVNYFLRVGPRRLWAFWRAILLPLEPLERLKCPFFLYFGVAISFSFLYFIIYYSTFSLIIKWFSKLFLQLSLSFFTFVFCWSGKRLLGIIAHIFVMSNHFLKFPGFIFSYFCFSQKWQKIIREYIILFRYVKSLLKVPWFYLLLLLFFSEVIKDIGLQAEFRQFFFTK